MPNVSTFDPTASFGAPVGVGEQAFEFTELQSAGFVAPPPAGGFDLGGLVGGGAGALASLIPVVGPVLGALLPGLSQGLLGGGGGGGPDALLQAERQRNRTQSLQALTQLSQGSQDSGVLRSILQAFLVDQNLVGKVQIGVTEKGKPRTVKFKPGDIESLTALGSGGIATKRGLESFQRFTGSEIVADALTRFTGGSAFSSFQLTPVPIEERFAGPTQAGRAAALDPFLSFSALPGGAPVPSVPTTPGFLQGVTDFFGGIFNPEPFVGPTAEPFTGTGPGFDFGDITDFVGGIFQGGTAAGPIQPLLQLGSQFLPNLFGGGDSGGGGAPSPIAPVAMPGGAPLLNPFNLPLDPFGLFTGDTTVPSVPTTPGAGFPQARTVTSTRLPHMVASTVPTANGGSRIVAYRNMGRPVLWSGDFAAARRVRKVAAKAKRTRGGR